MVVKSNIIRSAIPNMGVLKTVIKAGMILICKNLSGVKDTDPISPSSLRIVKGLICHLD
jgi:hypothetical protein